LLDYKDSYILNLLISTNQTLNMLDLSKLLGISQRSAYYSMSRINDYLESVDLPKLVNKRQHGIQIEQIVKDKLHKNLFTDLQNVYLSTQKERTVIQILMLLSKSNTISIQYFEDIFEVSRNTIVSDIKEVRKTLSKYNLALEYDSHAGYIVEGSALRKRSVVLSLIGNYEYLLKINAYDLLENNDVLFVQSLFHKVEEDLGIKYVNNTLVYLSNLIAIIKKNDLDEVLFNDDDKKIITGSKEFYAINKIFKDYLNEKDRVYIALHLLGLRIQNIYSFETYEDEYIIDIVKFMMDEFSRRTLIYFDEDQKLFKDLYLHMKQAMFRLKYGIIFQNELKEQIFENYPQVTQITEKICEKLEKKLGYPIGDDDIAYIAMHFGGHLKREKREFPKVKVLLVCLNGIATSKLLKKELEYLLGNIEIIDVVRVDEIEEYKDDVDFIISTIPLNDSSIKDKSIQVNTILSDSDKQNIMNLFGVTNPIQTDIDLSSLIIEDIKEYIPKNKIEDIRRKILYRISKKYYSIDNHGRMNKPMLKELISESNIIFLDKVNTWQDAIYESGKPLLKTKYIEQSYIDKVISNVNELGPYIVIAPNIAISHARPEDGVNELGMTMLLLDQPVNFSETTERFAKVVVTLAAPDDEKHLLALQQLSRLFMEGLDELLASNTKEQVLKLIEKYSSEEN